jgi:C4-dicarboxylate transporter, DcuC family
MFMFLGVFIILATILLLVKGWETRVTLFISGMLMAILSGNIMFGFNAFSQAMKNSNLIEPIVASMGFAMVLQATKCDQHLIHFLARILKKFGPFLVPGAVIATALVNTSITSAGGCSAAVGAILIPVLIGAGVHPAMAAAAVFAGTYGSPMLNPGFGQIAIVANVSKSAPMQVVSNHAVVVVILAIISAISLFILAKVLKEDKGYINPDFSGVANLKINYMIAIVPMIPLLLLVLGSTGIVPVFKQLAISHAMLIGCVAAFAVTGMPLKDVSNAFFKGFGDGFSSVFGIITMALVFVSGVQAFGIIKWLIKIMVANPAIAKISATFGPFFLGVISGSGEAASIAFNQAVTIHATELGMNPLNLGSLAAISGALGRTMSPLAGACIICAGFAKVNPLALAKRNFPGMIIGVIVTMIILMYLH